jgi:predicted glycosyltransferase
MHRPKIWIDIKNSHEPLFFKSLIKDLPYKFQITARRYAEITSLLDKYGIEYKVVGTYHGKNKVSKALFLSIRVLKLYLSVKNFDFSLSHGSIYSIMASRLKGIPSITITDNDFNNSINRRIFENSTYLIIPDALSTHDFRVNDVRRFDGFKEDIYIADFNPKECENEIPFDEYIIIRPEAYKAYYIEGMEKSIVPDLIKRFRKENLNIVLLPRYPEERQRYRNMEGVFIPERPVNGLCASYYSAAVLTGSGTMGREAACMGIPSVSFFPGKTLLSVDREMINKGMLFHSRDPEEIAKYVLSHRKQTNPDFSRSKRVKRQVVSAIRDIVER